MTSKRVLVTGGAGFIGSHVTRRLVGAGHEVRVVDNLATGFRANLDGVLDRVDLRIADLVEPAVCHAAVEGVEVIFHVAALPSVPRSLTDPIGTHHANVTATLNLLDAAKRAGVRRFVYSGSSSAYGDTAVLPKDESAAPLPRSPYAAAKLAGELYTLAYARTGLIEGVALRYFNVFGPRQDPGSAYAAIIPLLFQAAVAGTPVTLYGDGRQTRDFTYVDNVVDANLLAAEGPADRITGQVVNVGSGGRTSLLELVSLVESVSQRNIAVRFSPARAGDVRDSQAGLDQALAVLGYTPRLDVREGLERLWHWQVSDQDAEFAATS